jgi:hypothetical protein
MAAPSSPDSVRVVESDPWGTAGLGTQNDRVTDTMRTLPRLFRALGGKLSNEPGRHLEDCAIETKEQLKLIVII